MASEQIRSHQRRPSQSCLLDDISLSLSWSSKSSSYDDFTQLLDNICDDGGSPASLELIEDSPQQQWTTELEPGSSNHPDNLVNESNVGCVQLHACSVNAQEAKGVVVAPLMQWSEDEANKIRDNDPQCQRKLQQASMIRKLTVGFGIGKLLQHVSQQQDPPISSYSWSQLCSLCSVDNFVVESINDEAPSKSGWEVTRVHMITPFLSAQIDTSCSSSSDSSFKIESEAEMSGRNVDASVISTDQSVYVDSATLETSTQDFLLCHLLGVLLHFLFAGSQSDQIKRQGAPKVDRDSDPFGDQVVLFNGPAIKKQSFNFSPSGQQSSSCNELINVRHDSQIVRGADFFQSISIVGHENAPNHSSDNFGFQVNTNLALLKELGYPTSLSELIRNLVECGLGLFRPDDSYPSLDVAINDIQLLLQKPNLFLSSDLPTAVNAFVASGKLYGRSNEIASLTNAYYRVASSGISEAVFVGGFSGCGKTRLVHSVFESIKNAGGYAVTRKFDEMKSSSPMTVVLSALNQLCILVGQKSSERCLMEIYEKLTRAIGLTNVSFLTRILPNAIDLLPSHITLPHSNSQAGINVNSLCFIIQHLMRVLSSRSRTVLLFLDDLQWADSMSLKLVQCVLSDVRSLNCLLFVGCFRENEVERGHVLLEFFDSLSTFDLVSSMINLNGISASDVNAMISDTLGVFPRLCEGLSDVVFRKTNGNPFFTLEFLRSLITRHLVEYSLRNKCWEWNVDQICSENITDNVLHLLTRKMNVLSESNQTALKVASCFGSIVSIDIVRTLSSTSQYFGLQKMLDETVVTEGFMDRDETRYRFVHDKVREAAYGLIADKEQYHFDLGMALQRNGSDIFASANQVNRGQLALLQNDPRRISIVNLNYLASMRSLDCSDFTAAYTYLNSAISLLPNDSWRTHYDLTLKCYFQLAKAAYSCGRVNRAQQICEKIIECGKCLEDTLETYSLLVSMICLARKDLLLAFKTCLKVLNLLGEHIPDDVADTNSTVMKAKMLFQKRSNEDLLASAVEQTSRNIRIMEFFSQLVTVAIIVKPRRICQFYVARWASFCLTHRVACKYTPGAFVSFASMLSRDLDDDARLACRISMTGMTMLNRNESAMIQQLPVVYSVHYMWVGNLTEPIQSAVAMSRHAYDIGMQTGNLSHAAFSLAIMMARSLYAGTNLKSLKTDLEVHLKSAKQNSQLILLANLVIMHEVVSNLIGDEKTQSVLTPNPPDEDFRFTVEMFSSFYLGHAERVHYKSKVCERLDESEKRNVPIHYTYSVFFSGIASFRLYSYGKKDSQTHIKNLAKAMLVLEKATGFSEWNFKNKYLLLKAAYLSITDHKINVEDEFASAILASHASKFVHEEGLACELAAMHHLNCGNEALAFSLFRQAKSCYKKWGSRVKEYHIASQIDGIQNKCTEN